MPKYAYDIECFENLFTATFVNIDDAADEHSFVIGLSRDDSKELTKFLNQKMTLIGYNNHSYDDPMLRFFLTYGGNKLTQDMFKLSGKLIDDFYTTDKTILKLRYPKEYISMWKSIDLMRILAFDKLGISLKQVAINLKWPRIQDLPLEPDSMVSFGQLDLVISYNRNDVLITKRLYEEILPLIKMREELSSIYHVDLVSASDSRMANLILEYIYANELRMDIRTIKDSRTPREKVFLNSCIAKFIEFKSHELQDLLDRIKATVVYQYNNYVYTENINFAGCTFTLGIGGLHSNDAPGKFETDDKFIIQDADVSSYYPNLIINNHFYPQHLGINFIKVLKKITEERMTAKKSGNKVKADGLKITVNSIFGKLGLKDFWLFDPKQMLSTTITGQLGLLMLIEDLYLNGIYILSANTDGIVCKIPRELEPKYLEIVEEWSKKTKLEVEFTRYKKYVRRDVNTYITEKEDGSIKEKGGFLKEVDLKKSYHMPIVAKALYAYFINNIPVRKTIKECKDIMEFCMSQKAGSNFVFELLTINGKEILQKTNRFYASTKGGSLLKRDKYTGKMTGLYVGNTVKILNDYNPDVKFEDYAVDFSFYEKEAMKFIDEIEPKQISLFDMSAMEFGRMQKMQVREVPVEKNIMVGHWDISEEDINYLELNKLGKNQLLNKLESVVKNGQIIKGINPRYVYVTDFDSKNMTATIYCLAKSILQTVMVDKDSYKKYGFPKNQLMFATKFEKRDSDFYLVDYKVVNKLEKEKQNLL